VENLILHLKAISGVLWVILIRIGVIILSLIFISAIASGLQIGPDAILSLIILGSILVIIWNIAILPFWKWLTEMYAGYWHDAQYNRAMKEVSKEKPYCQFCVYIKDVYNSQHGHAYPAPPTKENRRHTCGK